MRSFWSDPYLWVHLAGAAAVPLLLELCLLGLGVGSPLRPIGLEFVLVGTIGVAPVLWMQWQRPFSIFSLVILALKPDRLTIDQRRILKLFKAPLERVVAVLTAIALLAILWQLYQIAPIASEVTPFGQFGRLGGVLVAAIAFLGCNLFLQIPVSVLRVLLTSEKQFGATEPYPIERIAQDFTLLGLPIQQILPIVKVEMKGQAEVTPEKLTPEKLEPEAVEIEPSEELAIASSITTLTVAPIEPVVNVLEDTLDELQDSKDFSKPASEIIPEIIPETIPEITSETISEAILEAILDSTPEVIAEPLSEHTSETIHIIELELIDDSEVPYIEVTVAEEEIIAVEETIEEKTIEIEIQYIPDEIIIDSSAEGAIEESNWDDDDWEEES